ncbi:hypothetical protein CAI21_21275 [Alkalilimnicola ehrlichii]|uniref:Uncharacterized protein n=1 Tax=Alkalilimnicola ehrlichii TaxID=351052 RepID=A0A3E0WHC3_9GAMM|nr:hypothetical protein [Alkalilimnicola ehrlichii]RFA24524.1 hypothetical protein CAI21_21275 [Alkalilimnicola ehrlichii]RFA32168.1 hypothetical protein CAL65_20320 [Alkalilimnicola ehrlichii]
MSTPQRISATVLATMLTALLGCSGDGDPSSSVRSPHIEPPEQNRSFAVYNVAGGDIPSPTNWPLLALQQRYDDLSRTTDWGAEIAEAVGPNVLRAFQASNTVPVSAKQWTLRISEGDIANGSLEGAVAVFRLHTHSDGSPDHNQQPSKLQRGDDYELSANGDTLTIELSDLLEGDGYYVATVSNALRTNDDEPVYASNDYLQVKGRAPLSPRAGQGLRHLHEQAQAELAVLEQFGLVDRDALIASWGVRTAPTLRAYQAIRTALAEAPTASLDVPAPTDGTIFVPGTVKIPNYLPGYQNPDEDGTPNVSHWRCGGADCAAVHNTQYLLPDTVEWTEFGFSLAVSRDFCTTSRETPVVLVQAGEGHFGDIANALVGQGLAAIHLDAPLIEALDSDALRTSRDSLRQGVVNLLAMSEVVKANQAFGELSTLCDSDSGSITLDDRRVRFLGEGFGSVMGAAFVALDGDVDRAAFVDSAAGLGGLFAADTELDTETRRQLELIAQTVLDVADPLVFVHPLRDQQAALAFYKTRNSPFPDNARSALIEALSANEGELDDNYQNVVTFLGGQD